jgi:hypothetical protein
MTQKPVSVVPKRGRGRPKKIYAEGEKYASKKVGLPAVFLPTRHDLNEELSMLDGYAYSRNNK